MRFLTLSAERLPLIITLAIVICLSAGYYFVYIPGNETYIKEWKFRSLKHIGKNIQAKIYTGHKQLKTYLHSDSLKTFIQTDGIKSKKASSRQVNKFLLGLKSKNLPISGILRADSVRTIGETLITNTSPKKLILADTARRDENIYQLNLSYDFDQFISPLLTNEVFDEYLIIGDNVVLYETFASGLTPNEDSLFRTCGALPGALITERDYAGISYKLFVLPVDLNASTRILLVGLLTADHFSEAKTRLPPRLVLFLITVFTCILVTFPIVKLYHLSEGDRLTLKDVISVSIVSALLVSLVFFCFVKYSTTFSEDKRHTKQRLASAISDAYIKEIQDNYRKLDLLDNCIIQNSEFDKNFYDVGKSVPASSQELEKINSIVKGSQLDRVFWMTKKGEEFRTWTTAVDSTFSPGQFDERPYFRNTMQERTYALAGIDSAQLYVDQIVSWVSGKFLTVIAKPSKYKPVAVILFSAQSLKKSRIPPGYSFVMIDNNGRVLYHSDTTKNLNENLFEEFSDERNLQMSIKSGTDRSFKTQYYGREFDVQMKPVGGGLPFYMVIMEDLIFDEYRDINVYTFTFLMQLILFGLIIIQVLAIFLASAQRLSFKDRMFETSWLGPKATSRKEYFFAGVFNLSQFIVLAVCFTDETILNRIFMLLSSISLMPVFLNLLFYTRYRNEPGAEKLALFKRKGVSVGILFILFLMIIAWIMPHQSFWVLIEFQLVILGMGGLLYLAYWLFSEDELIGKFICYEKAYVAMLVSWTLVSMGLPILLFFRAAYNYDQHLIARYIQLEMAEANAGEIAHLPRNTSNRSLTSRQQYEIQQSLYKDQYWVDSISFDMNKGPFREKDEAAINLLRSFHLYSNEKMPDRININNAAAFDFSFYFNNLLRQNPDERGASVIYFRLLPETYLVIKSVALDFHLPDARYAGGFLPWLMFSLAIAAFCRVVFGLVRKIFSLRMVGEQPSPAFDIKTWIKGKQPERTFLIGFQGICASASSDLPSKQVLDLAKMPMQKDSPNNDWDLKVNAACMDPNATIIIENFERDFKSIETNNQKIAFLGKVLHVSGNRKLMVCSTVHPAVMLAASKAAAPKEAGPQDEERWHSLLRSFRIIIDPVTPPDFEKKDSRLKGIKPSEKEVFDGYVENYHQYFSIWQSLSEEEKFILYDLAEDGLVNSFDKDTFRILIRKGLVVEGSGRFSLFSKSFRNFILSGLSSSELAVITAKINDNTNWNKIRVPLMLVSLAILVFIISSQREASLKLLTTLGALATAIPALINLLSAVSGGNKKPAT
ncbi:cache domain-containing protein [Dyadobacter psychrophilus]|uniref:Uncharacterized protein n=1 Tax=Dyadobacter psychrophilus TaxID=651661 RepID=A0A1T5D9F3_9BACT|nr:cache domain-containing protein [Dyadobacter psychrophilus]SKB68408.1 hypothetical protein SAMN05660293_01458 [Dyadobacter psychrophilus]